MLFFKDFKCGNYNFFRYTLENIYVCFDTCVEGIFKDFPVDCLSSSVKACGASITL